MNFIKQLVNDWLPPALLRVYRNLLGKGIRFKGDYKTWDKAAALCTGYNAESILERVLEATLKVKHGEAIYERDSVLFDEIQYSWPVIAALMWAAARNSGELHVLDFGGSLGSSYFQNRIFLSKLRKISWSVVEQSNFVDIGREQISDSILSFSKNIDESCEEFTPNVVLLSGVLQYLPEPFAVLETIASKKIDFIVIDRLPLSNDAVSKIKIQYVPASIYSASYPCWFLSRDSLIGKMNALNYQVVESFDALDKLSNQAKWQGMIFEKAEK